MCSCVMSISVNFLFVLWYIFSICIQISLFMLSKSESCSPGRSPQSSPGLAVSLAASPSAQPLVVTSGTGECFGLGSAEEDVQGSGVPSHGDIHPCGKSSEDVGDSAVCSGQFFFRRGWCAVVLAAGGWGLHHCWHPACSSTGSCISCEWWLWLLCRSLSGWTAPFCC